MTNFEFNNDQLIEKKSIRRRLQGILIISIASLLCSFAVFYFFYQKTLETMNMAYHLDKNLVKLEFIKDSLAKLTKDIHSQSLNNQTVRTLYFKELEAISMNFKDLQNSHLPNSNLSFPLEEFSQSLESIKSISALMFQKQQFAHKAVVDQLTLELQESINSASVQVRSKLNETYSLIQQKQQHPILINIFITLGLLIILLSFGYFTLHRVSQFIRYQLQATQQLSQGNLESKVPIIEADELGRLSHEFNKMTQDLRVSHKELEQSNQDLKDFAHTASHDLKAPIRHIKSFTDLLTKNKDAASEEEIKTWSQNIETSVQRINLMLDDLLKFSEIGRKNLQANWVNLNDVVPHIVKQAKNQKENIIIHVSPLTSVWGFQNLLSLVFQNLIENGIKYSPKDRIEISVEMAETDSHWEFIVTDKGFGIPEEQREFAFALFHRLKNPNRNRQGTGAGLAICRKIIDAHGGDIWVEENKPQGSKFHFTLPKTLS